MNDQIIIRGAREHNLRNVSLTVPRDKLVVFTGLSGSGKSSLAFDTIYAEGQRRYVEACPAMRGSSWGRWRSPMLTRLTACPPLSPLTRKPPAAIRARPSAR